MVEGRVRISVNAKKNAARYIHRSMRLYRVYIPYAPPPPPSLPMFVLSGCQVIVPSPVPTSRRSRSYYRH